MSEEEYFRWRSLDVTCDATSKAGVVSISAATDESGEISRFEIRAFNRAHVLTPDNLRTLRGMPLDGFGLTHEAGYEKTGGYSVHVKLHRAFYEDGTLVEKRATITVSETQGIAIHVDRK